MHLFWPPFLHLLLAGLAKADRKVPTDIQANLLFPRHNETYTPTQWFPLVFGVQNLDAVWPLSAYFEITVFKIQEEPANYTRWGPNRNLDTYFLEVSDLTPNQTLFHIPITSLTNGTEEHFRISWEFGFNQRCYANESDWLANDPFHRWSNSPNRFTVREIDFYTEYGAQIPDIENSINACEGSSLAADTAVRITEFRYESETMDGMGWGSTSGEKNCPVLDTSSLEPDRCAYKPFAKEVAANISEDLLSRMRCEEGTWQTIQGYCPKGAATRRELHWIFALTLAVAAGCIL